MPFMSRGEPQSVPDPDGDAYDEMLRRYRLQQAQNSDTSDVISGGAGDDELNGNDCSDTVSLADRVVDAARRPISDFIAKDANGRPLHPVGHPGLAESMVPVVGSAHEAAADFQEGHPVLGLGNAVLAGLETTGAWDIGTDALKLVRFGRSNTWGAIRKVALKEGLLEPFNPGHHIVHRKDIPKWVPDFLTNNWLNILPMKDQVIDGVAHTGAQVHRRLHGRAQVGGELLPKFNPMQQLRYGTKKSTRALLGWLPETGGRIVGDGISDWLNDPLAGETATPKYDQP